jgi:crotonobetainyl-CoA:carnitine CoA-transferase CaiB-like acyl-CoA transferase
MARDGMSGALGDVKVIEFTSAMAGPWIGRFMAWCGAEVIRVESKKRPDVVRLYVPPRSPETGIQPQLSPWFTDWNAGKLFVALDLARPEAVGLAKRLVARADVVIENQSAGVMEKLGLGYPELQKVKPDLVMLSTSGYGNTGPCRRYVTWGPNLEALSGLARLSGFPGRECTMTQYAYPDAVSALHGLFAVMCALEYRARTGTGQHIDLSQLESTVAVLGDVLSECLRSGREPRKLGNRSLRAAPQGCYRCAGEDRWCAIAVLEDSEWQGLCRVLGKPEWVSDPRFVTLSARLESSTELDRLIEGWTAARDPYEVMRLLQEAGVPAGIVQTPEDHLLHDPQLAARGFLEEVDHLAKGTILATGIPLGLTGTPGRTGRAGAAVGQDNEYVFRDLLGLSREEIEGLTELGAIEAISREAVR